MDVQHDEMEKSKMTPPFLTWAADWLVVPVTEKEKIGT